MRINVPITYSGSAVNGFMVAQIQMWSLSVGCRDLTLPCIINPVSAKNPMTNIKRNHQPAITTCLVPSARLDNSYALLRSLQLPLDAAAPAPAFGPADLSMCILKYPRYF